MNNFLLPLLILLSISMEVGSADILLPAFKNIQEYYGLNTHQVENLVSFNLLGLAISSVLYGPISDRFGRRPTFLFGVALFSLCAFSLCYIEKASALFIARFFQGLGGGACATVGMAMLKDHFDSKAYTKALSFIGSVVCASPVIFPFLGAYLLSKNTHFIFYFVALFSLCLFLSLLLYLPETKKHHSFDLKKSFSQYKTVLMNKQFMSYACICGLTYAVLWVYITIVSFYAVKTCALNPFYLAWILLINVVFSIIGSYVQNKLVSHYSIKQCLSIGIALGLFCALGLLSAFILNNPLWVVVGFCSVYGLANVLVFTNASDLAMDSFPENYGSAASVINGSELFWSSLAVYLSGLLYNDTVMPIVIVSITCVFSILLLCFNAFRTKLALNESPLGAS